MCVITERKTESEKTARKRRKTKRENYLKKAGAQQLCGLKEMDEIKGAQRSQRCLSDELVQAAKILKIRSPRNQFDHQHDCFDFPTCHCATVHNVYYTHFDPPRRRRASVRHSSCTYLHLLNSYCEFRPNGLMKRLAVCQRTLLPAAS